MSNILLNADSYKASHYVQYPANTTVVSSYIESRGGMFEQTLFFGLQAFIKQTLLKPFTQADIDEAEAVLVAHGLPFNKTGWQYILDTYNGYLPIEIQAVPEGSLVNTHNVLVQVKNTDDNCAWLTSYIETALLRAVWYPTTVASVSYACKQVIARYLARTADNMEGLLFKLHDFGSRGASSFESAALGGMAHLVNFMGTDTLSAIVAARRYYQEPMAGFSIPAAEHSTITSWGRDGEQAAYANMLKQFSGQGKLVAVVSDSYDLWNAIDNLWGTELRDAVMNSGGTLVIRPDSGDPVQIVSTTIEKLMAKFGFRTNSKGFKVLPDCVRVIQGDGICLSSIEAILVEMTKRGLSADNIAFGMGGELLQKVNRDTQKFAMKASAVCVNGVWRDVFKDPITDSGKRSKKGRLALVKNSEGQYQTIREQDLGQQQNQLRVVYRNGVLLVDESLAKIRARVTHCI
ncbi:nicotinate phosphoribosyltransferase [uncultured Agitococcus sp.]|uniref:nicotinate phosphoribosyltransferase n=1 Tax=uncultured Agitococcus sp. TaxID=1506599 RepID=UPI002614C204|nr:nicotinate phosphoribosyltransferase [uncultured Agitococcus sp.]